MKTDELLYPPGTRVAYFYDSDKQYRRSYNKDSITVVVVRVTPNGWYTYEEDITFDFPARDKCLRMAMKWIAERGYILDQTARAAERVPAVNQAIRRRLREVTQ